jgi:hypothetical protein
MVSDHGLGRWTKIHGRDGGYARVVLRGSQVRYRQLHDGGIWEPVAIGTFECDLAEAGLSMADGAEVASNATAAR